MSERKPKYEQRVNTVVRQMAAFLEGRAKTFTVDANLDHGAHLFGATFNGEGRTYTSKQVIEAVNRMVDLCRNPETGKPHGTVRSALDAKGRPALTGAKAAYRITQQKNKNGRNILAVHAAGPFRGPKHLHAAQDAYRRANHGDKLVVYTVTGVDGEWTSKKHAVKAGCRALFPDYWKAANALEDAEATAARNAVKARVPLMANGEPASTVKKPKATKAPAATVKMSAAQAKTMAKTMGATADECKTKAASVAFLRTQGILV